ncbi:hypothetical protein HDU67_007133 [Dinochytrium kinnereticum]|nr:hypothetical protein HDU67_007133 [Dinochytrium kinnereticum]
MNFITAGHHPNASQAVNSSAIFNSTSASLPQIIKADSHKFPASKSSAEMVASYGVIGDRAKNVNAEDMMIVMDNNTLARGVSKTYDCGWEGCGKRCTRKQDLERHMVTHFKDKRHICPSCEISFSRKDAMRRHLKMERCKTKRPGSSLGK